MSSISIDCWSRYRTVLQRAYLSDPGVLRQISTESRADFWKFFEKYISIAVRKRQSRADGTEATATVDQSVKEHKCLSAADLSKVDRHRLKDVPFNVTNEFESILDAYLVFIDHEKDAKLNKLRDFQASLPIAGFREQIVNAVASHPVVIICGDTGCGKSTQVPQYLLDAGWEKIACTQPRRIACISLANRVSQETLQEYGTKIAYQIRFERTKTPATKLLFLTEGLLLRQMASDGDLSIYDVVILDEAHERHLQGDFLLGMLKQLVAHGRAGLKVLIMSATINVDLFASYFDGAPFVQVPGRLFPTRVEYLPIEEDPEQGFTARRERIDPRPYIRILQRIDNKYPSSERGDVLIFLSGIKEITTIADAMKPYAEGTQRWIILMLHSTLALEEQDKVFDIAPEGVRKCILSTNIAETSVTIDGIRFVVDSGKTKEMTFQHSFNMHSLKETWISKASAEQRRGRAGRTGPGVCFRLYSEDDFGKLDEYTQSDIHRISLETLVLQMYQLGISCPRSFPFIEAPKPEKLEEAIELLKDHGLLKLDESSLTPLGTMMAKFPVDIPIGKMLILGSLFRQIEPVAVMAAVLSVQSPFTNRSFRELSCMMRRQELASRHGDPFMLLNVYREWLSVKADGRSSSKRWCQKRGIEEQRLYEVTKLKHQFKELLEDADMIERHEENLTSAERRIRHGQLKRLRNLKREFRNVNKRRKVLSIDRYDAVTQDYEDELEAGDEPNDINAVDFQIRHTSADVRDDLGNLELGAVSQSIVSMILCTALYPFYGILDDRNCNKQGSDQVIHTKTKPFAVLHPNGCLAQDPDVLYISTDFEGKSSQHQVIFYSLMLDTTKPYVINSFRVPALHSLLITARRIDTSEDFHRLVIDEFVEFKIVDSGIAASLLLASIRIRNLMKECVQRKLAGDRFHEHQLTKQLVQFLSVEATFKVRRIFPSQANGLYVGVGGGPSILHLSQEMKDELKLDSSNLKEVPITGGWAIAEHVTWGSLLEMRLSAVSYEHYLTSHWVCPKCGDKLLVDPVARINHLELCDSTTPGTSCSLNPDIAEDAAGQQQDSEVEVLEHHVIPMNAFTRDYFCNICHQSLKLTSSEILRHKKSHKRVIIL